MRFLVHVLAFCAAFYLSALNAAAQDDDGKGFLTRQLQNLLSGAGREVSIDGFEGALSSEASFDRMTIADDDGVWLTLEDVVLDWNRSALLRGRLEVESLTAERLDVARLPIPQEAELPDAEAAPFSLPDLPVAIRIAQFGIEDITLGAPLLGAPAQLTLSASAQFDDEVAAIDMQARRTDATEGSFVIRADLNRDESLLDLLVRLEEGADGITARLLNLPDRPSVTLAVEGDGPLSAFSADIDLSTDGAERIAGTVTLGTQTPRRASDVPDRRVQADIGGDITPLLAPRFQAFFGDDMRLVIDALLEGSGAIEVSSFALNTQAAALEGRVSLNQESWPTLIDMRGRVAAADGTPLLLPVGGEGTTVGEVTLRVDYDAEAGEALDADFDIADLSLTGAEIDRIALSLDGTLQGAVGSVGQFAGDIRFDADGLALADQALSEAIGTQISGAANVVYAEGAPTRISDLQVSGTDVALSGSAVIEGVETGLATQLQARLEAGNLSRFSALAGREIDGQTALAIEGRVVPLSGQFDITAEGTTQDVALGIAQADAVLAGRTELRLAARRDETGTFLRDLVLENAALSLTGQAELRTENSRAEADFRLNDIGLVVPQYEGPVTVSATAVQDVEGWRVDARTDGPYGAALTAQGLATGPDARLEFTADIPQVSDFAPEIEGAVDLDGVLSNTDEGWRVDTEATGPHGIEATIAGLVAPALNVNFDMRLPDVAPFVPQVSGALSASGNVTQTQAGYVVDVVANGPYAVRAAVEGLATGPNMRLEVDLSLPDVSPLAPGVSGPFRTTGEVSQNPQGLMVDLDASGPYSATASVEGLATGPDMRLDVALAVPDVSPLVPNVSGPLSAEGVVRQTSRGIAVDISADGPYAATAAVNGIATGPQMQLSFDLSVPNVNPLVPSVSGPLSAGGTVRQAETGIAVTVNAAGPYSAQARVAGVETGPDADVEFSLDMPNLGAIVTDLNGPLRVDGSASRAGAGWRIETDVAGPSGTSADLSGTVAGDGTLNLDIVGDAPLGLTRPFLEPRVLQGTARFDLSVSGPPALSSLSGTITARDASFAAPNLRLALRGIAADVQLSGSNARIEVSGQATNGGSLRATGSIGLSGGLPADIGIALRDLVLIDPRLYRTSVDGDLRLSGPLAGGARIAGAVAVGETIVNVPSTGITTIGDIPPITHIGATRPVISTRRKAGLDNAEAGDDPTDDGSGGFGLDVAVNAPNRIFVRGRGLDAELGGNLRLTGTTARIISAGRFDLLRGRLDILGQRFDLVEGSVQFRGDLVPFIRFVSATQTQTGEVRVIVEGRADAPEVRFEATPEAPQDEVLAQLLFGRDISEISAFQALQLANAVATLAGRGGSGVISNLRDGFGLDDLDITTTDDGATAVRAGKYISENVYTDVTAASDGTAEVSLNLDITSNLKGKATLESDGNSGIGIFYERDY